MDKLLPLDLYGHKDRWPISGNFLHRVSSDTDDRYANSEPGDVGETILERGESTFLITVENITDD